MYVGYISIGADDPFAQPPQESVEVVNNPRAYAYASWAGLSWLNPCDECVGVADVVPGGPNFTNPIDDPAPWYDPANPDTAGFLGVVGMEVSGASDSTRQANVSMSLTGVGVIGPTYMAPREMVVRALAIAQDDCSLEAGLVWLRRQYGTTINPCGGDPMTFFDCCPCVCDDEGTGGPCWARNYGELKNDPACDTEFWPNTYAELITGPSPTDEEWCDWPDVYRELRTGPPPWSCCIDQCVVPYMRQFHNTRVTAGPIILRRPTMNTCGVFAEIEFTIVAGDPQVHGMPFMAVREWVGGGPDSEIIVDPEPVAPAPDPFAAVA